MVMFHSYVELAEAFNPDPVPRFMQHGRIFVEHASVHSRSLDTPQSPSEQVYQCWPASKSRVSRLMITRVVTLWYFNIAMENHHSECVNPLFHWRCSIVFCKLLPEGAQSDSKSIFDRPPQKPFSNTFVVGW